jgi:hypothetical protein
LAVDKDGKTWAGNDIHIPDDFWQWIIDIDIQHKIEIYKDSFYRTDLTTIQNDTRERNMLAKYMGEGGWHIQLDADEYFIDFKNFIDFLHYLDNKKRHINCVKVQWLSLYKKMTNSFLFVNDKDGYNPLATTVPNYTVCRNIKNQRAMYYSQRLIHDSWARTEEALWIKLHNWGHNKDFDIEGYFHYWKVIDEKNYMFAKNLHPLCPEFWKGLEKVEGRNIQELLENIKSNSTLLNADKPNNFFYKNMNSPELFLPPIIFKLFKKHK